MASYSKKRNCFMVVFTVYLLTCVPSRTMAGIFGGHGGGSGIGDILAAGIITKLLMEDFGSFGGGDGGGRNAAAGGGARQPPAFSLLDQIGQNLIWAAARHHQRYITPKKEASYLKYSFLPAPMLNRPNPFLTSEMRLRPQFAFPQRPLLLNDATNTIPMMSLPYKDLFSDQLSSADALNLMGLSDPLEDAATSSLPFYIDDDDLVGLHSTLQPVVHPRPTERRPKYLLPRIVRHFVQRIIQRGNH